MLQDDDSAYARTDPEAAWPRAAYVRLAVLASACVRGHRAKRPWMGEVLDQLGNLGDGICDEDSNAGKEAGGRVSNVEERRGHLRAVDANGRSRSGTNESAERSAEGPRTELKQRMSDQASVSGSENAAGGSERGAIRPPYSANYDVRLSEYERDIVGPSALWAPARPAAPRKCARKKGEQIADELEGGLEQREAPEVSWWPRDGGQTLTLDDAPRRERIHPGMPAAGGPR